MNDGRPCLNLPGIFGAGKPKDARPDEAAELCGQCPYKVECLDQFAAANRPEWVPFSMTVAGLQNEKLRRAMRLVREGKAA